MTPRQMDYLAAWWQAGGSNVGAAEILNLSPQIVRNELHHLRQAEGAPDNFSLVQKYRRWVIGRTPKPTQRNVDLRSPERGSSI